MTFEEDLHSRPEVAQFVADGNDAAIVEYYNAKTIDAYGRLSVHDVKQYLSIKGLRLPIMDSAAMSCRAMTISMQDFEASGYDLGDPLILGAVSQVLDGVVAETLIPDFTADDKAAILDLAKTKVSLAEKNGWIVDFPALTAALGV